jgi:hypothetical protein
MCTVTKLGIMRQLRLLDYTSIRILMYCYYMLFLNLLLFLIAKSANVGGFIEILVLSLRHHRVGTN